jgi:hypothetical protein
VPEIMVISTFAGCVLPYSDQFDPATSHSARRDDVGTARWEMADDLIANHLPIGMSRPEILTLLGPSEGDDWWGDGTASWSIGCWIDRDLVVVEFDPAGRLERAYHAQD